MKSLLVLASLFSLVAAGIQETPCQTCGEFCQYPVGNEMWTGMCQPNLVCNQDEIDPNCAAVPDLPCVTNGDCAVDKTCASGLCVDACSPIIPCPVGSVCGEGVCRPSCNQFTPCPGGLTCNFVDGYCGEGCAELFNGNTCVGAGDYCENNVCHTGCLRDSDCRGFGLGCVLGKCTLGSGTCSKNSDCEETELCHQGSCQEFCSDDTDCPVPGSACHDGLCAPVCPFSGCLPGETCYDDEVCLPGCFADSDCVSDSEICADAVCQTACESDDDCIFEGEPYCINELCSASESCDANCSTWFNGCGICECNEGTISGCAVPECEDPVSSFCADDAVGTCLEWFTEWQCGANSVPKANPQEKCYTNSAFVGIGALRQEKKCTAHDCCSQPFLNSRLQSLQNLQSINTLNELSQLAAIEQSQQYQVLAQLQLYQAMQASQYGVQQQLMFMGPHHGHHNRWGSHYGWGY